jgi:acyl carrier protein
VKDEKVAEVKEMKAKLGDLEFELKALEEEFGIEIPDEEAEKLVTVGDAIKYIEEKAGQKAS